MCLIVSTIRALLSIFRIGTMEINKASQLGPHTHTRAEGHAPVWGSDFNTKVATLHGG
jgi:hypothetical protein